MLKTHNTLPEGIRIQSAKLPSFSIATLIEEVTTADLFAESSRVADQQPWFVESCLALKQFNLSKGH